MTAYEKNLELRSRLSRIGVEATDAQAATLRRAEMTLHRWAELECGNSSDRCSWAIERDVDDTATCTQCGHKWDGDTATSGNCPKCGDCAPIRRKATGRPYWCVCPHDGKMRRHRIPDREAGALRRVAALCKELGLHFYHQTDPRGAVLYVDREPLTDQTYSRAVCCGV